MGFRRTCPRLRKARRMALHPPGNPVQGDRALRMVEPSQGVGPVLQKKVWSADDQSGYVKTC